jgi:hypothetical protein
MKWPWVQEIIDEAAEIVVRPENQYNPGLADTQQGFGENEEKEYKIKFGQVRFRRRWGCCGESPFIKVPMLDNANRIYMGHWCTAPNFTESLVFLRKGSWDPNQWV